MCHKEKSRGARRGRHPASVRLITWHVIEPIRCSTILRSSPRATKHPKRLASARHCTSDRKSRRELCKSCLQRRNRRSGSSTCGRRLTTKPSVMFPMACFQPISVGAFTKGLTYSDLWFMRSSLQFSLSATSSPLLCCCENSRDEVSAASDTTGTRERTAAQLATKAKRPRSHRFANTEFH